MRKAFSLVAMAGLASLGACQLRVVTHNISNYAGGRTADLQKIYFSEFSGRSMRPDVILGQEFQSQAAVNSFLSMLNTAANSTQNWRAAPFTDGPDTDSILFYRDDKVELLGTRIVSNGGGAPEPPRNTMRYDLRLKGYAVLQPKVAVYVVHLKAGDTTSDEARRLVETTRIRTDAQGLDASFWGFLIGGDMNLYRSSDDSYQKLIGSEANNAGRFFDPISRPGSWDGSNTYKIIHTQDPSNSMNSRFDLILLSAGLVNSLGMDYKGAYGTPYGETTWDSVTHSYRSWGNDGGHSMSSPLRVTGNTMVGPDIAQSLKTVATAAGGHLPVFLDLLAPGETQALTASATFGKVILGASKSLPLNFKNNFNASLWSVTGVANLPWKAATAAPLTLDTAAGTLSPGQTGTINVTLNAAAVGTVGANVVITPDDPRGNPVTIPITGEVVPNQFVPPTFAPWGFDPVSFSGGLAQYQSSDNATFNVNVPRAFGRNDRRPAVLFTGTAPVTTVATLGLKLELSATQPGRTVTVNAVDRFGLQITLGSFSPGPTDTVTTLNVPDPNRFVNPTTGQVQVILTTFSPTPGPAYALKIDQLSFVISG